MSVSLNDHELGALAGLPDLALRLYVLGLRPYMDYTDGTIGGNSSRISLSVLARRCYIEPRPGRKDSGSPTIKAIRHALKVLAQIGLIARVSDPDFLVLQMPLAHFDQKIRGTNGAQMGHGQRGTREQRNHAASEAIRGKDGAAQKIAKGALYPVSDIPEEITDSVVDRGCGGKGANDVADDAPPSAVPTQPEQPAAKAKTARGTRLPADWTLPADWRQWAQTNRPDVDPSQQADIFRDYWVALSGQRATKMDWFATWRNWIRSAKQTTTKPSAPPANTYQAKRNAVMGVMWADDDHIQPADITPTNGRTLQ